MYVDDQNGNPSDYAVGVSDQEGASNSDHLDDNSEDNEQSVSGNEYPEQSARQQKATAIKQAILNKEKAKQATAEAEYLKYENQVLRDTSKILDLHSESPELAEQIARNVWGLSYDDLIAQANQKTGNSSTSEDMEKTVERVLNKQAARAEKDKIEELKIEFFIQHDITEKSPTFKRMLNDYSDFPVPKTAAQAKRILELLYLQHTGKKSEGVYDIDGVPGLRSKTVKDNSKTSLSNAAHDPAALKFMLDRYGEDGVKKYLKSKS